MALFPDMEAWAVSYILDALAGRSETYTSDVHVSNEVPNPRLERMVIVRRDGGTRQSVAHEVARLGIRVFAGNDEDAADLTAMVRALLEESPGNGPVRRYTEIAGPARLIEDSGQPVRYFVSELTVRGGTL